MTRHNETRVRLEGFTYGHLEGIAYMPHPSLPEYGYHVMSDCGKVGMTVNIAKAEARIQDAVGLPVFYYD